MNWFLRKSQNHSASKPLFVQRDPTSRLNHNLTSLSAIAFILPYTTFLGTKLSGLEMQRKLSSCQFVCSMPNSVLLFSIESDGAVACLFICRAAGF